MEPTTVIEAAEQTSFIAEAFDKGGTSMYFIAAAGLLVLIIIIERFLKLQSLAVDKEDFQSKLFSMITRGDLRQALTYCDSIRAPLANTMKAGLEQVLNQRPDEEVQVAMDGAILRETPRIEGWTSFLAVLGNVATLMGLLGTIIGMIIAFGGVADADPAEKSQKLSEGIAHALNATAGGLSVAIPALIFYGLFQIRIGRIINDMQETSMRLMNLVVANRDKMKG